MFCVGIKSNTWWASSRATSPCARELTSAAAPARSQPQLVVPVARAPPPASLLADAHARSSRPASPVAHSQFPLTRVAPALPCSSRALAAPALPCSAPSPGMQQLRAGQQWPVGSAVAPGCFSVYVGPERERFVVRADRANHPPSRSTATRRRGPSCCPAPSTPSSTCSSTWTTTSRTTTMARPPWPRRRPYAACSAPAAGTSRSGRRGTGAQPGQVHADVLVLLADGGWR
ncbi:hypothetical protein VPH35_056135 [Triticum aestivum]|uniref:Uncharacterized protein n=1 Tax=Triticum aestivum TaxID=4565 RepID=A0A077S527_WHEAT|nr:unnamed protein product [Triticum aestivum]